MRDLSKIGKLTRLHGLKGALVLVGDNLSNLKINKNGFLFIEINSIPTPFFLKEHKQSGKNISVLFDGITSSEQAKNLVGKEVWADKKNVSYKENVEKNLRGYQVVDENKGVIGIVEEVIEMPHQNFLTITINDKEVLLPFADSLIKEINHNKKTIHYCAPEGLFDIN